MVVYQNKGGFQTLLIVLVDIFNEAGRVGLGRQSWLDRSSFVPCSMPLEGNPLFFFEPEDNAVSPTGFYSDTSWVRKRLLCPWNNASTMWLPVRRNPLTYTIYSTLTYTIYSTLYCNMNCQLNDATVVVLIDEWHVGRVFFNNMIKCIDIFKWC